MAVMTAKVPAVVATGIVCALIGGGIGAGIMSYVDSKKKPEAAAADAKDADAKDAGDGATKKGGGKGGKGKGGGGGAGPAQPPKTQLAQFVTRLDQLTNKSLVVELKPEEKKQLLDILAGLDKKDDLTDDEAKTRFEALLKILEPHKAKFEAAGYRWPPPGGRYPPAGELGPLLPPSPFTEGEAAAPALKSLNSTLGK